MTFVSLRMNASEAAVRPNVSRSQHVGKSICPSGAPLSPSPVPFAMRLLTIVAIACLVLPLTGSCSTASPPSDSSEAAAYELELAFPELHFTRPLDLQDPPGTDRLFVVAQRGLIKSFPHDSAAASTETFLDLQDQVLDEGNEQGLLGLAFHPDFAENGYFFVNYTAAGPQRTVVARYRADPNDPTRALPSSEKVILEVGQPYGNHNGGDLVFGPDGYLYITLGDGGAGGDPQENGQDPTTLLASILRIDVDDASEGRAYGIPPDNPFVGTPGEGRPEIYAYGLRNAWRMSFDPETGQLWTGDVGQNAYEEVDVIRKGANYGWNTMEGTHCFDPKEGCDRSGLAGPVLDYPHAEGQSITGGYVYRGERLPGLQGQYVFADYASGRVWTVPQAAGDRSSGQAEPTLLLNSDKRIASFATDAEHRLYVLAFDGQIYRFTPSEEDTGEASSASE